MPAAVVLMSDSIATLPLAGRTAGEHWDEVLARAGLNRIPPSEVAQAPGVVAIDGRFAGLAPAHLRELAVLVSVVGGRLLTPKGDLVAVAHPAGALEGGAGPLTSSGGHALTVGRDDALGGDATAPIDDEWGRALAERAIVTRRLKRLAAVGVRLVMPHTIHVDTTVRVAPGATLHGGCVLLGQTRVDRDATIHAGAWLRDTTVGEGTVIKPHSVLDGATVGPKSSVGPMAHLRPQAVLERDVKVGNFVEVKKAVLHEGVRASHLSYLGDAEIGEHANIGAGTITCNYDGVAKYRTTIGARAFIGSNSALVAPVKVGADTIVGAGSTITRDVANEGLAVERGQERVIEGKAPAIWERNRARARKLRGEDG
ncbi:MAG: DapH/DapD/GlmU-related protein [Myxococcota bacterium]